MGLTQSHSLVISCQAHFTTSLFTNCIILQTGLGEASHVASRWSSWRFCEEVPESRLGDSSWSWTHGTRGQAWASLEDACLIPL